MFKHIACVAVLAATLTAGGALANEPERDVIGDILGDPQSQGQAVEQHKMLAHQYLFMLRTGQGSGPFDYELLRLHLSFGALKPEDIGTTEEELQKLKPREPTAIPIY